MPALDVALTWVHVLGAVVFLGTMFVGTFVLLVFGLKLFFAAVPVLIFVLAPRILGAKTEEHLCCDPDADDSPVFKGVMTTKGAALHYTAIAGGWRSGRSSGAGATGLSGWATTTVSRRCPTPC